MSEEQRARFLRLEVIALVGTLESECECDGILKKRREAVSVALGFDLETMMIMVGCGCV